MQLQTILLIHEFFNCIEKSCSVKEAIEDMDSHLGCVHDAVRCLVIDTNYSTQEWKLLISNGLTPALGKNCGTLQKCL